MSLCPRSSIPCSRFGHRRRQEVSVGERPKYIAIAQQLVAAFMGGAKYHGYSGALIPSITDATFIFLRRFLRISDTRSLA